jgi:hypothetical protein
LRGPRPACIRGKRCKGIRTGSRNANCLDWHLLPQSDTPAHTDPTAPWDVAMDDPSPEQARSGSGVRLWLLTYSTALQRYVPTPFAAAPRPFLCECIRTLLKEATSKNRYLQEWLFPALRTALAEWLARETTPTTPSNPQLAPAAQSIPSAPSAPSASSAPSNQPEQHNEPEQHEQPREHEEHSTTSESFGRAPPLVPASNVLRLPYKNKNASV